jgi:DNA processing protein
VAGRLAAALAEAGAVVVSGLAAGIDAAAHQGALEAGGYTIAFQACGPDRVYPAMHRSLAGRIEKRGAVVSEFAPGTPALPHHFPLRNRLISGLATLVVVVEARVRSGSLVTARLAADQGRDVFAVPGPITSPVSEGPNRLLRDGAGVADGPEVILEELRRDGHLPPQGRRPRSEAGRGEPSRERNRILQSLHDQPATRDELGQRLACPPQALALELLELEMEGRIREDRDGRFRVVA